MTRPPDNERTLTAPRLTMVSPRLIWPSPTRAVTPSRLTATMVVPWKRCIAVEGITGPGPVSLAGDTRENAAIDDGAQPIGSRPALVHDHRAVTLNSTRQDARFSRGHPAGSGGSVGRCAGRLTRGCGSEESFRRRSR